MSTQSRSLKGGAECFLWDEGWISGRRREAEAEAGTGRYDGGRWRVLLLDLKGILYTKNPIPKKRATVSISPSLLLPVYLCFAGVICARARRWVGGSPFSTGPSLRARPRPKEKHRRRREGVCEPSAPWHIHLGPRPVLFVLPPQASMGPCEACLTLVDPLSYLYFFLGLYLETSGAGFCDSFSHSKGGFGFN